MEFPVLSELMARLAINAVDMQRLFDSSYNAEVEAFTLPGISAPWAADLLRGSAPSRLIFKTFQIDTSVLLGVSSAQGFALVALPINLAYNVRHSIDCTKHSRIVVTVEQCAQPAAKIKI